MSPAPLGRWPEVWPFGTDGPSARPVRRWLPALIGRLRFGALTLVVLSIALGRLDPEPARVSLPPTRATLDWFWFMDPRGGPRLLDVDEGTPRPVAIARGLRLVRASVSPWRGERDQGQLVGAYADVPWDGSPGLSSGFGLARVALPGEEVLNRVALEVQPSGPPCWRPEPIAQVVFAGADGRLRSVAFERKGRTGGFFRVAEPRSELVGWAGDDPEGGPALVRDVHWPSDPRLRRYLLVSAVDARQFRAKGWGAELRLWWAELDPDRGRIIAAGQLAPGGPASEKPFDQRLPAVGVSPTGEMVVAYLERIRGQFDARLMIAPLRLDPESGVPGYDPADAVVAAESCLCLAPIFSADGRFVTCFLGSQARYTGLRRVEVARLLPRHKPDEVRPNAIDRVEPAPLGGMGTTPNP